MMKLSYVAALLVILIRCLMCVYSIKCYQCRSDMQGRCVELQGDEYLLDCPQRSARRSLTNFLKNQLGRRRFETFPYCRKITQALYFTPEYLYMTIRECAYTHELSENCFRSPWKDSKVVACDCATEGCNRGFSGHRRKSFWTLVFCIFFSLVSWRFFLRDTQEVLLKWS